MINELPTPYIQRMKETLGPEADELLLSYSQPKTQGLRSNPLKTDTTSDVFSRLQEMFELTPVPWCPTGFYYPESVRPGKHPFHQAGLYYIQEPSAMSAAELLAPLPGDTVLDLAAAPGGKASQIAGKLGGEGLMLANEIHPGRAKILAENLERMGVRNAVVTNTSPEVLAERFPLFFDRILLDAPCSGEGMFRKDPGAVLEWSPEHVTMCAARQKDIIQHAIRMLKPGGTLVYSTCTFSRDENEMVVDSLLSGHPDLELLKTERLWPHRHRGEGHFAAVLSRVGDSREEESSIRSNSKPDRTSMDAYRLYSQFAGVRRIPLIELEEGEPVLFGEQLYWLPHDKQRLFGSFRLPGLKTVRPGLHLGRVRKHRFEPAHALAVAMQLENRQELSVPLHALAADSAETAAYLRGETLACPPSMKGWTLVAVDGHPLGWGKASSGQLKNHYPKGLRLR